MTDVRIDMPVLGRDGAELGSVEKVVIKPGSARLVALVVGSRSSGRVVVPAEAISEVRAGAVQTTLSGAGAAELAEFDETAYRQPGERWRAPTGLPPEAVLWPGLDPPYPVADPPLAAPTADLPAIREPVDAPTDLSAPAGSHQQQRKALHKNPYNADPYDVLEPGLTATKTPFERDDASMVNPQPRPDDEPG